MGYKETVGYSIDSFQHYNYGGKNMYSSIVEFEAEGKTYTCASEIKSNCRHKKDKKYKVLYDPNYPYKAFIKNQYLYPGIVTIIIGILLLTY